MSLGFLSTGDRASFLVFLKKPIARGTLSACPSALISSQSRSGYVAELFHKNTDFGLPCELNKAMTFNRLLSPNHDEFQ